MLPSRTHVLVGILILGLGILARSTHIPKLVNLPPLCEVKRPPGEVLLINESVILTTLTSSAITLDVCEIVLAAKKENNMVLINFLDFDIGNNCTDGKLDIFDNSTGLTITDTLCGHSLKKTVFRSYTRVIALVAIPSKHPFTPYPPNLNILFTSYNNGTNGKCSKGEFQCDNKLCIAGDLVCNRYNDCPDNSDEKNCGATPSPKPPGHTPVNIGLVAGLAVGGVVFLVLIVLGVGLLMRYRKRRGYEKA